MEKTVSLSKSIGQVNRYVEFIDKLLPTNAVVNKKQQSI